MFILICRMMDMSALQYNTRISSPALRNIMRMIEIRSIDIIRKWFTYVGEIISYYC